MDDLTYLALETLKLNKQAIIFNPSRASAEKAAEEISKLTDLNCPEFEKEVLKAATVPTKQCRRLSHCLKKGIAFHHAGLLPKQRELIEEEFRKGNLKIICATPTLCLSGDTEIWQPNGNTSVKNLKNSNLFALSQGNKLIVMKAQKVNKINNSQKLIEITSVSGYSIKLTNNHKILVKRNKKKLLITAIECKKKDKIATIAKLSLDKTVGPQISNFVVDNELPIPDRELKEYDFYLIGSMIGDGYSGAETRDDKIIYKGSPTFTSNDLESTEKIERIIKLFDPFSKRVKRFGAISLVLSKKRWFREFLCRCGIEIGKNKHINPLLMQADINLVKYLIRGLFDTDGYIQTGRNIGFSNISPQLIKDLQRLLLRFGIVSRIRERPGKKIKIIRKIYQIKPQYELIISQQNCILAFNKLIGLDLSRKQIALDKLAQGISQIIYSQCKTCNYKIYSDLFSGRTKEQKKWGLKKREVIKLLGKNEELGSKEIQTILGFLPRHPKGNRLNHHYELITKRKIGSRSKTEWFWRLNEIGKFIYNIIIIPNKDLSSFFDLSQCPLCKGEMHQELRKKWRNSDFEGDIFWDYVRTVTEVPTEKEVYDVILPDKPNNYHMFVANGIIVHNSAGLSLPAFRVIIKSLKRYSGSWGMDWIPVLEYLQMSGRAGRPEYEPYGESIVIAKDESEKEEIIDRYLHGQPEEIYSKLAAEPILRTYLLALISSGIIHDQKTLDRFFSQTFWAHQFKDLKKLQEITAKTLNLLEEWQFVSLEKIASSAAKKNSEFVSASKLTNLSPHQKMNPTSLGKRISELYLDPLTARHFLDCLQNYDDTKNIYSLLQMISHTLELRPLLRIKVKEQDFIQEELTKHYHFLLEDEPSVYDLEYSEFMNSIKTSLFLEEWIEEKDEDYLLEKYDITPGDIRAKLEIADWLIYSAEELARFIDNKLALSDLHKLRIRIKQGVKEELLPLIRLKGIGRVRARKLFSQGIKDLGDLKKIDQTSLGQILGKALAEDLKSQLGEDIKEIPKGTRKGQLSLEKY
jgi:helicase